MTEVMIYDWSLVIVHFYTRLHCSLSCVANVILSEERIKV